MAANEDRVISHTPILSGSSQAKRIGRELATGELSSIATA